MIISLTSLAGEWMKMNGLFKNTIFRDVASSSFVYRVYT